MKKIMILILFSPLMAMSQKKPDSIKPIPDSLPSISLNEYADDINNFIKYLGGLRQDIYEILTPKQTIEQYWKIVLLKRKKL